MRRRGGLRLIGTVFRWRSSNHDLMLCFTSLLHRLLLFLVFLSAEIDTLRASTSR